MTFHSGLFRAGFPENISPRPVSDDIPQLTILVKLSDGVDPGKFEALDDFHESFGWVYKKYPKKQFQIVPFSLDKDGGVKAYLMVEQPKAPETL